MQGLFFIAVLMMLDNYEDRLLAVTSCDRMMLTLLTLTLALIMAMIVAHFENFSFTSVAASLTPFRQRSVTATAYVLPGGKIRPAGSRIHSASKAIPLRESMETRRKKKMQPSSSWHGRTHDMIDFFLDDYEVIGQDAIDQAAMSDIESVSTSITSNSQLPLDSNSCDSSDGGMEVDITERLKEYNIISLSESPVFGWDRQFSLYE